MKPEVLYKETVSAGIKRFTPIMQRRITSAMVRSGTRIKTAAQRRLVWRTSKAGPGGRSDGSRLANSILAKLVKSTPTLVQVDIGPGVSYAPYVEGWPEPPKRHFVPFSVAPDLLRWLTKHGVDVPAKAKGWMVGGPDSSTPFMRPAADEVVPKLLAELARELRV